MANASFGALFATISSKCEDVGSRRRVTIKSDGAGGIIGCSSVKIYHKNHAASSKGQTYCRP
jgi:hypothetical protein